MRINKYKHNTPKTIHEIQANLFVDAMHKEKIENK